MQPEEASRLSKPLAGRTIAITRARSQAAEFAEKLERLGARTILCPVIEFAPPASYDELDQAIDNLFGYDWIIFTSVNGVDYFLERFAKLGHDISELDDLRVCAVGETTALRLSESAIHVDLVPVEFKAEGILEALISFLGTAEGLAHLNFLMPRAAVARDFLPRKLTEAGARVDSVPAYQTISAGSTEKRRIQTLLAGGGVDCITFTSGSTIRNFAKLFDVGDLQSILHDVVIACIGDVTKQVADEFGLETQIIPKESTIESLTAAIAAWFNR